MYNPLKELSESICDVNPEDDFPQYHKDNPQIYEEFKKLTLEAIDMGYKHWGAHGVFEMIRWRTATRAKESGKAGDTFKITDTYCPFYARLFMKEFPQYNGFFRTKNSKFDNIKGLGI